MKSKVLVCIVSGIEKRVSGNTVVKQSVRFGTTEQFESHFVCREAKQLLKKHVQPDQVQSQLLPAGKKPFSIDLVVLARLKLLKKPKTERNKASTNIVFNATPPREFDSFKAYVEEMTGGKNRCQVVQGGTCIRPDIYFDNEYNKQGNCYPCPYKEFCLVSSKKVLA
jgi:hypothetical protein